MLHKILYIPKKSDLKSQSGQIAVIVFLIMAVLLVVGLSLASRTSQEIELAGQQEDTTRVFNAAETGVEQALSDPSNFELQAGETDTKQIVLPNDAQTTGSYTITTQTDLQNEFEPGETATVFTNTGASGSIVISWGTAGSCANSAALVVTRYYREGSNVRAAHNGYTPPSCWDATKFLSTGVGTANGKYNFTYSVPSGTEMVRITPVYTRATLTVTGSSGILLPQEFEIRSQAQDSASGNTEVRAIEVTRSRPAPPAILDYALYSGDTLTK